MNTRRENTHIAIITVLLVVFFVIPLIVRFAIYLFGLIVR